MTLEKMTYWTELGFSKYSGSIRQTNPSEILPVFPLPPLLLDINPTTISLLSACLHGAPSASNNTCPFFAL